MVGLCWKPPRGPLTIVFVEAFTRSFVLPVPRRLSLRFPSRDMEREFLDRFAEEALPRYRLALPIVLIVWLSFGALDQYLFSGPALTEARVVRYAVVLPVIVALIALGYAPSRLFRRCWQLGTAIGFLSLVGALVHMQGIADPVSVHHAPAAVGLSLLGGYTMVMLRFLYATPVAAACTVYAAVRFAGTSAADGLLEAAVDTGVVWLVLANVVGMFACYELERFRRQKFAQRILIEQEQQRSESLLLNILPASTAKRLKAGDRQLVEGYDSVTVLFGDLVGFTEFAERMTPEELVRSLNQIFTEFDEIAERRGLEKIKTIGDAYMVVGGVPEKREDHAEEVVAMALDMLEVVERHRQAGELPLQIRIGVHTGPVVAGVIGVKRFSYDVWGDTVNTASRMQTHGVPGTVQISESTYERVRALYEVEARGSVKMKGKGEMKGYLLK